MKSAMLWLFVSALMMGVVGLGLAQEHGSEKYIRVFRIPLPIEESMATGIIVSWSRVTGIPVGVEGVFRTGGSNTYEPGRVVSSLDLSGMEIHESIAKMIEYMPQFKISDYGDMAVFRLKASTALDRKVDRFVLNNATYLQALEKIRQIYDPTWIAPDRPQVPTPGVTQDNEIAKQARDRYNARFTGSLNIDMSNVTVEQILNELARQLPGKGSWNINYAPPDRDLMKASIALIMRDGISINIGFNR
jgi:hypothetical protein